MKALLETDEEADSSLYAAYLRAQSDIDLLDIFAHLDGERYPARYDAARREIQMRSVLPVAYHSLEERFMRGLCVVALTLATVLLVLTLLLIVNFSTLPPWTDWNHIPNDTQVSVLMLQIFLKVLSSIIVAASDLAFWPLAVAIFAGWLLVRGPSRSVRADVKWLTALTIMCLAGALSLAVATCSPVLVFTHLGSFSGRFAPRLLTFLFPW